MRFPNRSGRLFWFLFWLAVGPLLLIFPASAWLYWTLEPLQKVYLTTYVASSVAAGFSHSEMTFRWVMKTAPGRKPVPASADDVVTGPDRKLPVHLSPKAIVNGWRGVAYSAPEKVSADSLAKGLQDYVYDGVSVWWLFGRPLLNSLAVLMLLYVLRVWMKERFNRNRAQEERHGRRTKGPEWASAFRWRGAKTEGIRFRLRFENRLLQWVPFGPSYRIPKRLEASHILMMGDTGSGKSNAIRQLLRQVRDRGETAIVYDPAMDFVSEFYLPARGDLILNPLDQRCPYWGLGQEIDRDETAATIAAAFLPEKEYEKEFFTDGPRRILAHLLKRKPQPRDILKMMADPSWIEAAVKGTPLAALLDPGAPAQRAGVLASLNMVADSLELLPEWEHTRPTFATTEWYTSRNRWVFLTSTPAYRAKILPLHSVWLDLFILRMMGYCADHKAKPVWFVLDELASLNRLPQLHTAVTENRKYGNPVVVGFQGRSQLEKRYGQDAEAMLSQPATKLFFKTTEPRAAKWISEAIGEIEVERLKESRSMGLLRSKKSYAMEIATKPLVMASEISGLEPLHGFIKQENRVVPVHFQFARKRGGQPEFIERKLPETAPRLSPPAPIARTEQTNTPAVTQAALSFCDMPADEPTDNPKEAFVWDESKGIE
ncbi:MAG TPA: type IV secretion system DNA-binding domain-containing protein [Candidatus Aquilonibacter sp.]|nr:type IV secretion system DNA-binding domain-containing protein [Candidatus Aquilonibacter sp.]